MSAVHKAKGPSDISKSGLLLVVWLGFGIATVLTAFRLYVRRIRLGRWFWDDAFHLLGWGLLLASAALLTSFSKILYKVRGVTTGGTALTIDFLQNEVPMYIRFEFTQILLFWSTLWSVKFAFLLFYRRFFTGLTSHMIAWWIVMAFTAASFLCTAIPFLFVCGSPKEYFEIGQCLSTRSIERTKISLKFSTAVDVLTDVMIMALPMRILWNLRVTGRQKLALATVFSLAVIVIIFAIVRAVETIKTLTPSALASLEGADPISLTLFSAVESTIAVIVSCLPTFRVLILGSSRESNRYQSDPEIPGISFSFRSSVMRSCSQGGTLSSLKCGLPPISKSREWGPKRWLSSKLGRKGTQAGKDAPPNLSYQSDGKSNKLPQFSQRTVESDQTLVGTPMTDITAMAPKPVAREWPPPLPPRISYFDLEIAGKNKPLPPQPPRASTRINEETYEAALRSLN